MTITQSTGDSLTIEEVSALAPGITFADVFRISFKDETGHFRWHADDVRALVAEYQAIDRVERANRPAWAEEGEWDGDTIVYRRDMSNKLVRVDQTLMREGEEWAFTAPASMYLPGSGGDDHSAASARLLVADLTEAITILEAK